MKIDILTIFPVFYENYLNTSIINKAIKKEIVNINIVDLKKFSSRKDGRVDEKPFGGGAGMLLRVDVVGTAIDSLKKENSKVIMLTPKGKTYSQSKALKLSKKEHIILICGHYEGFDNRILDYVDEEISIGDYILTGGEVASLVITDSVVRLLDGVISPESKNEESFENNLLEYPQYTKPRVFKNKVVPEVLLSGNHGKIKSWRKAKSEELTKRNRPDLYEKYEKESN